MKTSAKLGIARALFSCIALIAIVVNPTSAVQAPPLLHFTSAELEALTVPGVVPGQYTMGTYLAGGHGWTGTVPGGELAPYNTCPCYTLDPTGTGLRGNLLDHGWIGSGEPNPGPGPVVFTLAESKAEVFVFPAFDHSPWYGGLEFTVHGTNDATAAQNPSSFPSSAWTLGTLTTIYREGWEDASGSPSGNETDDYASKWTFPAPVAFVAVHAMNSITFSPDQPNLPDYENRCEGQTTPEGATLWCNDDMEIDGIATPVTPPPDPTPTPTPSATPSPSPSPTQTSTCDNDQDGDQDEGDDEGSGDDDDGENNDCDDGEQQQETNGCGVGYWKQDHHFDSWTAPFDPTDLFKDAFGADAFPGKTLLQVLKAGGGGLKALGRQAVAALLNSVHPEIDFRYTDTRVKELFRSAFESGDSDRIERQKDRFEEANSGDCPLS